MHIYYITGTSRGLGEALARGLLNNPDNRVHGIGRTNAIEHAHFRFTEMDLSDAAAVSNFRFGEHPGAASITLINNAGLIGHIRPAGQQQPESIIRIYQVNLIAPALLCNAFIKAYNEHTGIKQIVNISSGAGKNPIDGWSNYCATKAGLDMYSRTLDEEFKVYKRPDFRIWSVAPGVVDTGMQEEIRNAEPGKFSRLDQFITYHAEGQLADPALVAGKYFRIFESPSTFTEVVLSVKDIDP